ncbi:SLATT domain-containing protein [Chitinolyticbacter albus]|uniref:SLATT domain-containing protein n=1 Tax=Chitinolyticbacter albus TaxID=2961951 RepID=UPI002109AD64|nr:SLATT domain-containing protein [Chitinolyticbacter albus]
MENKQLNGAISLFDELRTDAKLGKSKHFNASRRKMGLHNWVGIPVVLINVFIGTVIVALLSDGAANKWVSIGSAILAFAAASLSALQTFFNFHKAAEGHSSVGNRYLGISRQCKKIIRKHEDIPYSAEDLWKEAEIIQSKYLAINTEAEAFPTNDNDLNKARTALEITPFVLEKPKVEQSA